jgi:gas vesicle protein
MDNSRELAAAIVGAVIGAVAGYLFLTERGRSMRRGIEPALDDFSREVMSFRNAVQKAAGVADECWKLFNDVVGEGGQLPARYPTGHTSPF